MTNLGFHQTEDFVEAVIKKHIAPHVLVLQARPVGGGCINHTFRIETTSGVYFLKYNFEKKSEFFEAEAKGLTLLKESQSFIFIPTPIAFGVELGVAYLLMEHVQQHKLNEDYWEDFGHNLAEMHRLPISNTFGLSYNNYIGSLNQINRPESASWSEFFIKNRLDILVKKAFHEKKITESIKLELESLYDPIAHVFPPSQPSLIHGDLWSGNVLSHHGKVALVDPSVYFADKEIEIAFTKLFGGFPPSFYDAYSEIHPLDADFEHVRMDVYNLYPLLVHTILFGEQYAKSVHFVVKRLLKLLK